MADTKTEFTVDVPEVGKVDLVRYYDGDDGEGNPQFFWDLYDQNGTCLNEGTAFWAKPTKTEILNFFNPLAAK